MRDSAALEPRALGLLPFARGVNLDTDGQLLSALNLDSGEAANSRNWRHQRGTLVPRSELRPFITLSPAATGRINCLYTQVFYDRSIFLIALDSVTGWAYNGSTLTDISVGSMAGGGDDDVWTCASPLGYLIACNGATELHYWDGNIVNNFKTVITGPAYAGPASLKCRYVTAFAGRAFMAHCQEGATVLAQRVRWSDDSNLFGWDASLGNGSGAADLSDTPGIITGIAANPDLLAVFKEDSIILGQETGDNRSPIVFPTYLKVGCLSQGSLQAIGPRELIFLGHDNVYILSGSGTTPVGTKIAKELYNLLDYARLRQIVSWTVPELQQYHLVIPVLGGSGYASRSYVFEWSTGYWSSDDYPTTITAAIRTNALNAVTWATLSGSWSAQTSTWANFGASTTRYAIILGTRYAASDYRLHKLDVPGVGSDTAGVASVINYDYWTGDLSFSPGFETTCDGFYVHVYAFAGASLTLNILDAYGNIAQGVTKSLTLGTQSVFFPFSLTAQFHKLNIRATTGVYVLSIQPVFTERGSLR